MSTFDSKPETQRGPSIWDHKQEETPFGQIESRPSAFPFPDDLAAPHPTPEITEQRGECMSFYAPEEEELRLLSMVTAPDKYEAKVDKGRMQIDAVYGKTHVPDQTISPNNKGLIRFPDDHKSIGRYSHTDEVKNGKEVPGADHYLSPDVGADLFNVIQAYSKIYPGDEILLGDMSRADGLDPGHGQMKNGKPMGHKQHKNGLDIDLRYIGKNGRAIQGKDAYLQADPERMKTFFRIAHEHGFTKNFSAKKFSEFVTLENNHKDHFHIGRSK